MMKTAGDFDSFRCINIMAWPLHNDIFPFVLCFVISCIRVFYSYLFGIHLHQGELSVGGARRGISSNVDRIWRLGGKEDGR